MIEATDIEEISLSIAGSEKDRSSLVEPKQPTKMIAEERSSVRSETKDIAYNEYF